MLKITDLTREFIRFFKNNWIWLMVIFVFSIVFNTYLTNIGNYKINKLIFYLFNIVPILIEIALLNLFMYEYTDRKFDLKIFLIYLGIRILIVFLFFEFSAFENFWTLLAYLIYFIIPIILIFFKYIFYCDGKSFKNSIIYSYKLFKLVFWELFLLLLIMQLLLIIPGIIYTKLNLDLNVLQNLQTSEMQQMFVKEFTTEFTKNKFIISYFVLIGMFKNIFIGICYYRIKKVNNKVGE